MRQAVPGSLERISRQADTPSPSGSRTSSTATSGRNAVTRASADATVPASPITSMPGSAVSRFRRPRRTTSWSSRRNTLIRACPSPVAASLAFIFGSFRAGRVGWTVHLRGRLVIASRKGPAGTVPAGPQAGPEPRPGVLYRPSVSIILLSVADSSTSGLPGQRDKTLAVSIRGAGRAARSGPVGANRTGWPSSRGQKWRCGFWSSMTLMRCEGRSAGC